MSGADWLQALRQRCEVTSQEDVAKLLDLSASTVSQVLTGNYAASTARIERKVRGALLHEMVACPIFFELGMHKCQSIQEQPSAKRLGDLEGRAWHVCRGIGAWARGAGPCPHYTPPPKRAVPRADGTTPTEPEEA